MSRVSRCISRIIPARSRTSFGDPWTRAEPIPALTPGVPWPSGDVSAHGARLTTGRTTRRAAPRRVREPNPDSPVLKSHPAALPNVDHRLRHPMCDLGRIGEPSPKSTRHPRGWVPAPRTGAGIRRKLDLPCTRIRLLEESSSLRLSIRGADRSVMKSRVVLLFTSLETSS